MKGYRSWSGRIGRMSIGVSPWALNLPRMAVMADGEEVEVAFSYGNGSSDPVLFAAVDLSSTWLGRLVGAAYWWVYEKRRSS